ncbi:hypothetical protein DEF23_03860 [Marinitenerispora sediminis]|uniref:Uncharacterized protein n=2 Tax=Marinitenerispora sediminis TaxID=1931232 RepID=A0A368TBE0_9ACTN|nr:hypothetical protein DEF28_09040 [Marinitenerispora sediminis]RCV60833.1 hypothetical protein DEF23_03860 [Marinitenerispora sediminis]RCV62463.1 hypothetical protein DEF24_01270 [Marinitenerispora sediminis]
MLPTTAQLQDQLVHLIGARLLDPLEILLEDAAMVDGVRTAVRIRAAAWARDMLEADDRVAIGLIMRAVATLYPGDGPFDPPTDWWRTPMGRVVAWRVGHPTAERVSYPVAGAMLGITRQGVHDLVARGRLPRHPEGGVLPTAIRDRLRQEGHTRHA